MRTRPAVRAAATTAGSAIAVLSLAATALPAQSAVAAARPATVLSIANPGMPSGHVFTVTGVLRVKSSGKEIAGAVIYLVENSVIVQHQTTNSSGKVTFKVTIDPGEGDWFTNDFLGNNSYVSSVSIGFEIINMG